MTVSMDDLKLKRLDNEKCYRFFNDEIPFTLHFIKSGFNGKFIRIYEDPYEGTSVELVPECSTCDGTGLVHSHNDKCWTCGGIGVEIRKSCRG